MISEPIQALLRNSIGSTWSLEVLLTLLASEGRAWSEAELIRETHSSDTVITGAVSQLQSAMLVQRDPDGHWRYAPQTPALDALVKQLALAYAKTPLAVIRALLSEPDQNLRNFANAFRLRKD